MSLTRAQVIEIVTESATAFVIREARLVADDATAYAKYHGISPAWPAREGSPQMAGHGTQIGGFRGQEEWHAARALLNTTRRIRKGQDNAWSVEARGDVVAYRYRFDTDLNLSYFGGSVELEIPTHGVDVSDCRTPTAAIAKVRTAHGLAA